MSSFLNFIKNCFPYRNIELRSPLTVEEALATLKTNIKPENTSLTPNRNIKFVGVVTNHDFQMTRDLSHEDHSDGTPSAPVIKGSVAENDNGSVIKIVIKAHMWFMLFMVAWSIVTILFMITGVIYDNYIGVIMITLGMFFVAGIFTVLEPHVESKAVKKFLCDTLDAKEV